MLIPVLAAAMLGTTHSPVVSHQYRVEINGTRGVDATARDTAAGGSYNIVAFVTTTVRDTAGGEVGHVLIDSARCSGMHLLSEQYDSSVGKASSGLSFDVKMIRDFRDLAPAPSKRNPVTDAMAPYMIALFPPMHHPDKVGDTWADTANLSTRGDNFTQSGPTITRWKVITMGSGGTHYDGDINGTVSFTGRFTASAVILGKHGVDLTPTGQVQHASLSTSQQMLYVRQDEADIRTLRGTTQTEILLVH